MDITGHEWFGQIVVPCHVAFANIKQNYVGCRKGQEFTEKNLFLKTQILSCSTEDC